MRTTLHARHALPLSALLLVIGCGGASRGLGRAFTPGWKSDDGRSIAQVQRRLAGAKLPAGAAVAVGVTKKGLVGLGLDGSGHWEHATPLDARPVIAGQVVVGTGGGKLFAFDATNGRQLWSLPDEGRRLVGAGDDGVTTVVSLGGQGSPGSLVLAVDHGGHVLRRLRPRPAIGDPAVLDGVLFLPWGDQYVSAVDIASGTEIGRLLMRNQVSRAMDIGGQLYFGQRSLVRFDDRIGKASFHQANRVSLPGNALPGAPEWFRDGAVVRQPGYGASDPSRLYARPTGTRGTPALDSSRYAATYFRIVIGLDSSDGSVRWARTLPANAIGGAAVASGFVVCDDKGNVWRIGAARGSDAGKVSLGEPLESCVVQAGDYRVSDGKPVGSLAEQMSEAVELPDPQMVTMQRYLLNRLGPIQDPIVTKVLIDLAENPRTPPRLLGDANKLLARRRSGEKYMLVSLERHYDYLSDVLRPPPVAPLADALAAMDVKAAAPLLARHLNDPADSPEDIEHAALALEKLATPAQYASLKTFFSLYRATADQTALVNAVVATGKTLMRVGGDAGRKVVEQAVHDPMTMPDVKRGLEGAVQPVPERKG